MAWAAAGAGHGQPPVQGGLVPPSPQAEAAGARAAGQGAIFVLEHASLETAKVGKVAPAARVWCAGVSSPMDSSLGAASEVAKARTHSLTSWTWGATELPPPELR